MNKQITLRDSGVAVSEIWKRLPQIESNPTKIKEYEVGIFNNHHDRINYQFLQSQRPEFGAWGGASNVGLIGYYNKYNPPPTFQGLRRMKRVLSYYYDNLGKYNKLFDLLNAKYLDFNRFADLHWFFGINEIGEDILFENRETQCYDEDLPLCEIMQNWECLIEDCESILLDKINKLCAKKEVQNV